VKRRELASEKWRYGGRETLKLVSVERDPSLFDIAPVVVRRAAPGSSGAHYSVVACAIRAVAGGAARLRRKPT
jgi:hypothetical protein